MIEIKENSTDQKLRGGYYTPSVIASFLCDWGIHKHTKKVLEPSCGDGNFIEAAIARFAHLGIRGGELKERIKGIELIESEFLKAKKRAAGFGLNSQTIVNSDFFNYITHHNKEKFDLVIGNPPFIRYQNFPEAHRTLAIELMQQLGLSPNKLTNIWVPFLVVSASLLNDHGKMAMVIPAELFQVNYAAQTRVFLSKYFERMTIITFKKLVFKDIQQEIVLLLCEKKVDHGKGIRVIECENVDALKDLNFMKINGSNVKPIDHSTEKWTKYFLEEEEIQLLKRLKQDKRVITCGDIMRVEVGLVTGRNEFFMLNEDQVNHWRLKRYVIPVVSKSNQLKGITFSDSDFTSNSSQKNSIYLFMPPDEDFENLPKVCQQYISYGEENNFHTGYKTRIRKRWYITPSLWVPDGFVLRQVGDYPKIIINESKATSTDTIHRVNFKHKVNQEIITASFLNSLSYAFSEITGRSYGGGVMTFEPTEIKQISIPDIGHMNLDFSYLDQLIRERRIEEALDLVDHEVLIQQKGFKKTEVKMLRNIWNKMALRRIKRNK